jgi:hypothetical protein
MDNFWEVAVPIVALFGSIALAAALLTRQRSRVKPDETERAAPVIPSSASRHQRKVLEKLEPQPEIPTLMDLVRTEIEELGIDKIPGHESLPKPVVLKVYRRDSLLLQECNHDALEFKLGDGVEPSEAMEDDVILFCLECGEPGTNDGE